MTETNELLDLIDELTAVHIETTPIDGQKPHIEKHDPLIKQLREAVASNLGGQGGKALNERVPLDTDALTKYQQIEAAIEERFRERCVSIPELLPEDNLRTWYRATDNLHRAGQLSDEMIEDEIRAMRQWVAIIKDKLSPATTQELAGQECPVCGFAWYDSVLNVSAPATRRPLTDRNSKQWNWSDIERRPALTVSYRPDDNGGLSGAFAKCGNCNHVWTGSQGIRALAYEIERKAEEAQHADAG